jgi:DNA modification methylase
MVNHAQNESFLGFHHLDARQLLSLFPKSDQGKHRECVDLTVTSPPYYDLKNYKFENQIGYGQKWEKYLEDMKNVFAATFEVTRPRGSMWVVADTFRKKGELVQLPLELSRVAKEASWTLRDVIIWEKEHTLPWSAKGQLRKSFEYILFFSKSRRFKYHIDRIREPQLKEWWVKFPERYNPKGKAPAGIWKFDIPVQGRWRHGFLRHFCPFPTKLIHRILLLCSDGGDVVFDPFAGSGVVLAVAEAMNRKFIGLDLQKEYITQFESEVRREISKEMDETLREQAKADQWRKDLERTIVGLRQIKYARTLLKQLANDSPETYQRMNSLFLFPKSSKSSKTISIRNTIYVVAENRTVGEKLKSQLENISKDAALSTFGVHAKIEATDKTDASKASWLGRRMFVYKNGTTWNFAEPFRVNTPQNLFDANQWNGIRNGGKPIISPIKLTIDLQKVIKAAKESEPELPRMQDLQVSGL